LTKYRDETEELSMLRGGVKGEVEFIATETPMLTATELPINAQVPLVRV